MLDNARQFPRRITVFSGALLLAGVAAFPRIVLAQMPTPAKTTQPASEGLDALSDDVLLTELAGRGLTTLLDRAFDANDVPVGKRNGIKSLLALRRLSDKTAKLTFSQRQALVKEVIAGIEAALPTLNDPNLLMQQAGQLIETTQRDVNTLEYWGEDPRAMSNLNSTARTVQKILDKAAKVAEAAANRAADSIHSVTDVAAQKRWEELDKVLGTAQYTRAMNVYPLALSIDSASPERKTATREAIEYLQQFDIDDNPDRNFVRLQIAKLAMGGAEYATARKVFDSVIKETTGNAFNQYNARYFLAMTELLAKKPVDARKRLDEVVAWQKTNLPPDKPTQDGVSAAASMLRFRIADFEAQHASDPAAKRKANDEAISELNHLSKDRPDLQGVIFEQLANRLPATPRLQDLDFLLLRALVQKGEETLRVESLADDDRTILARALSATGEIERRKGSPDVDATSLENAALLRGLFLEKLGRLPEAGNAYLDFVAQFGASTKNAALALGNAQAVVGTLRRDKPDDEAAGRLYDRFLSVAVKPPFSMKEFAFEYARRLQQQGNFAEAIKAYEQVPPSDKRSIYAKYFTTLALADQLRQQPAKSPLRAELGKRILTLAEDVKAIVTDAMTATTDEAQKKGLRPMLSGTTLLAANLAATEQQNPAMAITMLSGFEDSIKGMPNEANQLREMLSIRVQALMGLQKFSDATKELIKLVERDPTRGGQIVFDLLEKLEKELDSAQAAGNTDRILSVARNRAALTGFLVEWSRSNANPNIAKQAYAYSVYDANVQWFAASQEADLSLRKAALDRALDRFTRLDTPEDIAQYRADTPNSEKAQYDPRVVLGMGRSLYDLENFDRALKCFGQLLNDRTVGAPVIYSADGGSDNETYWEVVYKTLRANQKLDRDIDRSKSFLKQQYVQWGDRVGGQKWKGDFERLRKELIPEFDPAEFASPASQPANPASQPATEPVG